MKQTEFASPNDRLNGHNRQTDQLTDFLLQYGYEEPQLLQKENELLQQMISSIQSLNQILENLNIPDEEDPATKWITTKDVVLKYGISLRTQSAWRDTGKLLFSQVELKIYYKKQDLENLFIKGYHKLKNQEITSR